MKRGCKELMLSLLLVAAGAKLAVAAKGGPLATALWRWEMDGTSGPVALKTNGAARLAQTLPGLDHSESIRRGGDGKAAECNGGYLSTPPRFSPPHPLPSTALTVLLRARLPERPAPAGLAVINDITGKPVFALGLRDVGPGVWVADVETTQGTMTVGAVALPGETRGGWHDLLVRFDGRRLELFIDGVSRAVRTLPAALGPAGGLLGTVLVGAGWDGLKPTDPLRSGAVDHLAVWGRALDRGDIERLAGGKATVLAHDRQLRQSLDRMAREAPAHHRQRIAEAVAAVNNERRRAAQDPRRPLYHFQPPARWMNDPNGLLMLHGEYHLFYQHNPFGSDWDHMHWGHAKSVDLVHWKHLPIALAPAVDEGEEHVFSGSAVVNDGVPTLLYTSIGPAWPASNAAHQVMAVSHDEGITWEASPRHPVLTADTSGGLFLRELRDPSVWREGKDWLMVLGGHRQNGPGGAYLYRSSTLQEWSFVTTVLEGEEKNWECPNLFRMGDKWVLFYSPHDTVRYYTGTLDANFHFKAEFHGTLDQSTTFYAPASLADDSGRRLIWGWVRVRGDGWNGMLTLPRVLTLRPDGRLGVDPAPELQVLRGERRRWPVTELGAPAAGKPVLSPIRDGAVEIAAELEPGQATDLGLEIINSGTGQRLPWLHIQPAEERVTVGAVNTRFALLPGEKTFKLRVFIDQSVAEIFLNGREAFTIPLATTASTYGGLAPFARGPGARLLRLEAWRLHSAPPVVPAN